MNQHACFILWVIVSALVLITSLSGQSFVDESNATPTSVAVPPNAAWDVPTVKSPEVTPEDTPRLIRDPGAPTYAEKSKKRTWRTWQASDDLASLFEGTENIARLGDDTPCDAEYERAVNDPRRLAMTVPPIGMFREHLNAIQAHIRLRTQCYARLRRMLKARPTGRKVFIDMGSRMADSVTAFLEKFPNANEFELHCFEANSDFNDYYVAGGANGAWIDKFHTKVSHYNMAVSTVNSTMFLSEETVGSSIVVNGEKHGKQKAVRTINWNEFLLAHFDPGDFIILKMDIEKAEFAVLHLLLKSFAFLHIDHLLLECHCTTYVPPPRPKRLAKEIGRDECKKISRDFNEIGMTSVDWSKRKSAAEYARKHGKWYPT